MTERAQFMCVTRLTHGSGCRGIDSCWIALQARHVALGNERAALQAHLAGLNAARAANNNAAGSKRERGALDLDALSRTVIAKVC